MPDAKLISWISEKYNAIAADLDERARRRWAAAEAHSLGWGGIVAVEAAKRGIKIHHAVISNRGPASSGLSGKELARRTRLCRGRRGAAAAFQSDPRQI